MKKLKETFDYRNNLKQILQKTAGDERSLKNGLAAIKAVLGMVDSQSTAAQKTQATQTANKEIKQLLLGISQLIKSPGSNAAQKQSLSALHRLTFDQAIAKQYGSELAQLEVAIQQSTVTKEEVNQQVFEQAIKPNKPKRDYRKGKRYTVIRLVLGCDLINDNNEIVYTLTEKQIHQFNLTSGDIVEALPEPVTSHYEASILLVVGHRELATTEFDKIEEFKYAVVQGGTGHLAITHDIHGQKLRIRGKSIVLPIDASRYQTDDTPIVDGSIVDLAWYAGDVNLKKNPAQAIKLRWIYQLDQPQVKPKTKKKKIKQANSESKITKLALDLHYQRVGIAIGDNQNEVMLESIVRRYNGIPVAIDAFQGKKKLMDRQIQTLDLVILVTAFAAHDSTWNIREFASKYHVGFAVSSSKGYQAFERALYRAANGLPAYEGNQTITYETE